MSKNADKSVCAPIHWVNWNWQQCCVISTTNQTICTVLEVCWIRKLIQNKQDKNNDFFSHQIKTRTATARAKKAQEQQLRITNWSKFCHQIGPFSQLCRLEHYVFSLFIIYLTLPAANDTSQAAVGQSQRKGNWKQISQLICLGSNFSSYTNVVSDTELNGWGACFLEGTQQI